MDAEIWKDIPGYKGEYQASTIGRIKSLKRTVEKKWRGKIIHQSIKERIMKAYVGTHGYFVLGLRCFDRFTVEELILLTFVGLRPHKHVAMHLNDIKTDNRLDNLKWGTYKENNQSAAVKGHFHPGSYGKHGKNNPLSKSVRMIDNNGNIISEFDSMKDADKATGVCFKRISRACKRNIRAGGYYWRFQS